MVRIEQGELWSVEQLKVEKHIKASIVGKIVWEQKALNL